MSAPVNEGGSAATVLCSAGLQSCDMFSIVRPGCRNSPVPCIIQDYRQAMQISCFEPSSVGVSAWTLNGCSYRFPATGCGEVIKRHGTTCLRCRCCKCVQSDRGTDTHRHGTTTSTLSIHLSNSLMRGVLPPTLKAPRQRNKISGNCRRLQRWLQELSLCETPLEPRPVVLYSWSRGGQRGNELESWKRHTSGDLHLRPARGHGLESSQNFCRLCATQSHSSRPSRPSLGTCPVLNNPAEGSERVATWVTAYTMDLLSLQLSPALIGTRNQSRGLPRSHPIPRLFNNVKEWWCNTTVDTAAHNNRDRLAMTPNVTEHCEQRWVLGAELQSRGLNLTTARTAKRCLDRHGPITLYCGTVYCTALVSTRLNKGSLCTA